MSKASNTDASRQRRHTVQHAGAGVKTAIEPGLYAAAADGRISRRRVLLAGGLLLPVFLPLFGGLAHWQWQRAEIRLARQAELDARCQAAIREMPTTPASADSLRNYRFTLRGTYEPARQWLIDNRVHRQQAGYHVITPLRLEGSDMRVLVNRGWIPQGPDRNRLPAAPPPDSPVVLSGIAVVPPDEFFTLGPAADAGPRRQNLDLHRLRQELGQPLQPVLLLLDAAAPGGYVREWPRPDSGADRNRAYAVQWLGLALTSLGIWLFFLWRSS